jgi:hypothetical protein
MGFLATAFTGALDTAFLGLVLAGIDFLATTLDAGFLVDMFNP